MSYFVYGIDLAQNLNYCGIVILDVANTIQIKTLRKFNKVMYPEIKRFLLDEAFPRLPPTKIVVDYTNELSFSEELEVSMNPSFLINGSTFYKKWRYVTPYVFNNASKLELMQNAANLMQNKTFRFPEKDELGRYSPNPIIHELLEELHAQMMRVVADPMLNGGYKFPKPEGHDDDLVIALTLALMGAKELTTSYTGEEGIPLVWSGDYDNVSVLPNQDKVMLDIQQKYPGIFNTLNHMGTTRKVRIDIGEKTKEF